MLFRADHYRKLKCHQLVRSSAVEDIRIARTLKKRRYRTATLLGDNRVACRMYTNYREAVSGFSKNVMHFFFNSLLWMFLYVLFTTLGLVFVAFWSVGVALCCLAAALLMRVLISVISYQGVMLNLVFIPAQHVAFFHIIVTALKSLRDGNLQWKGRNIRI
jgi:chlorobactene glucosyltransferase